MSTQPLYFKQNILAAPLVNQWYAWPGLIAPATAAMYVANSHVKLMQSFVAAPQVHAAALRNPALRGGPFINHDPSRTPEIKELLDRTQSEQAHVLAFAEAVRQFGETLANEADGFTLEPLYRRMPDVLKGYVELIYDLNNSPSMRFIEGLLYKSRYYNPAGQSLSLSLVEQDERPFALSTPHLGGPGHVHLRSPFGSQGIDELFKAKTLPRPPAQLRDVLPVSDEDAELFSSFFTATPPAPAERYEGDSVRVRYMGHACLLIETAGCNILTDPVLSYKHNDGVFRYTYADLPDTLDYVLITHGHQDHLMFETLLQLRQVIKNIIVPKSGGGSIVDPSLKLMLQNLGFKRVAEVDEMETVEVEGGRLVALPFLGEHADLNVRAKLAYLINLRGKSILCAADSNNVEPRLYQHIHAEVGDVDAFFVGMECEGGPLSWLYGPLLPRPLARRQDQSRRLDGSDYEKVVDIVDQMRPERVYVYAMGQEPWLTYLTSIRYTDESRPIVESNRLVAECRRRGLTAERLFGSKEIAL